MFRTDPLTDTNKIDTAFFASSEFKPEQESLIQYLYDEGFDQYTKDFLIDYRSRRWHIFPENKKKNNKY
jgi:hypothetical protein